MEIWTFIWTDCHGPSTLSNTHWARYLQRKPWNHLAQILIGPSPDFLPCDKLGSSFKLVWIINMACQIKPRPASYFLRKDIWVMSLYFLFLATHEYLEIQAKVITRKKLKTSKFEFYSIGSWTSSPNYISSFLNHPSLERKKKWEYDTNNSLLSQQFESSVTKLYLILWFIAPIHTMCIVMMIYTSHVLWCEDQH